MDWLSKYWWILVLVFLVGVLLNVIKDLKRVDHKSSLPTNRIFRRTVILTTSGTMKTTGRRRTRRSIVHTLTGPSPQRDEGFYSLSLWGEG